MSDDQGKDVKGNRGGDTGPTKDVGKGPGAEKGDARREDLGHEGQTRNSPGARRTEDDEQPGAE